MFSDTNYPAWKQWVPEEAWARKRWEEHKLNHAAYLELSVRLRDGHERRKASVDAVVAAERETAVQAERAEARRVLAVSQKPFKPLPDKLQAWNVRPVAVDAV